MDKPQNNDRAEWQNVRESLAIQIHSSAVSIIIPVAFD